MFKVQLFVLRRVIFCSLLLVGITSQPLLAAPIVDLDRHHPLGTILTSTTGDQAYFSLGNGRAIQISLAEAKTDSDTLKKLLLVKADKTRKIRRIKRRNLRW